MEMDRYRFREMLDSPVDQEGWPSGIVIVMTRELARTEDIKRSLATTNWDLLIVDEFHQFKTGRALNLLRELTKLSSRVILSASSFVELPEVFDNKDTTVVAWTRDQLIDFDGMPLTTPERVTRIVPYDLSPDELSLASTLNKLCQLLRSGKQPRGLASTWTRSLYSSPAALEARIAKAEELISMPTDDSSGAFGDCEEDGFYEFDAETVGEASAITRRLQEEIEKLSKDSKLLVLVGLVNNLKMTDLSPRRVCVLTDYVATLFYVAAEIETLGNPLFILHGAMSFEDRQSSIDRFRSVGGVLIATSAIMSEGVALPDVTDLVFYDIPASPTVVQQILGRFDRFGRHIALKVYALSPSNDILGNLPESTKTVEQFVLAMGGEPCE
jgi:superfamily II DNA or RNA helicase